MKRWYGKLLGFFAGAALLRANPLLGALVGVLIGHAFDADWFRSRRDDPSRELGLAGDAEELPHQAETRARAINAAYHRIRTLRQRKD